MMGNKRNQKNRLDISDKISIILFVLLIIAVICSIFGIVQFIFTNSGGSKISADTEATEWIGEQKLNARSGEVGSIAIPGLTEMVLKANTTTQKVNIYNPEENNCYIVFTLLCNGDEIWHSDYCQPKSGYYEIEIKYPLLNGEYRGSLLYDCFRPDGTKLNSANILFPIYVQ